MKSIFYVYKSIKKNYIQKDFLKRSIYLKAKIKIEKNK